MSYCIFCKIIKNELPSCKIYEDNDFISFLDIAPVNKGHALVIPKKHCENLLDFPEELETQFIEVAKKVATAVTKATNADGFNLSLNNGEAAGQVVFHAHFHIIPRFKGDGHMHWDKISYEENEINDFKEKISSLMK